MAPVVIEVPNVALESARNYNPSCQLNRQQSHQRDNASVNKFDAITISASEGKIVDLELPLGIAETDWKPLGLPPIEVIDGQHRLWAFDDRSEAAGFELPVVAFYGLDISWQAYLFYTINIKPKKINASLAFDRYPLLRTEDWLERFEALLPNSWAT
jgi:hypothetical protein